VFFSIQPGAEHIKLGTASACALDRSTSGESIVLFLALVAGAPIWMAGRALFGSRTTIGPH
jgi:hypothetical protein